MLRVFTLQTQHEDGRTAEGYESWVQFGCFLSRYESAGSQADFGLLYMTSILIKRWP